MLSSPIFLRHMDPLSSDGNVWLTLIHATVDVSRGTLWRVREDVWKETSRSYDQHSTRQFHPGLSLLDKPPSSGYDQIPMAHGTSGTQGPVVARGLTAEKGPDHPTSFGHLITPVPLRDFLRPAADRDPDLLTGHWDEHSRIVPNFDKLRLDAEEDESLRRFRNSGGKP